MSNDLNGRVIDGALLIDDTDEDTITTCKECSITLLSSSDSDDGDHEE